MSSPAPSPGGAPVLSTATKPSPYNPYSFGKRLRRLLIGWAVGAALCGVLIGALQLRLWASLPRDFNAMQEEVGAVGDFRLVPWANHDNSELMYARNLSNCLGSFLVDLGSLKQTRPRVRGAKDNTRGGFTLLAWSPDDKNMVFSWTLMPGQANRQIGLCDGTTSALRISFAIPGPPRRVVWLTTNSMVMYLGENDLYLYNINSSSDLGKFGRKGLVMLRKLDSPPKTVTENAFSLVRISEKSIGYFDKGNVWTLDIPHNKAHELTDFTNETLEWLDYSPENSSFLFTVSDKGGPRYRRLCMLKPEADPDYQLIECSPHDNIFKGLWALKGKVIAYVDNVGSENCLAIDTPDQNLRTNLFLGGHMRSYSVSPNGERIYAIASPDDGPMGIWEYDIATKKLRNVAPPVSKPFAVAKLGTPVKTSVNGMGYFYVPPVHLEKQRQYPLVIDATRDSRWEAGSAILANADIFYAAVNRNGLANFLNLDTSPADIMQLYQDLLKNPNVDPARVYLAGTSAGSRGISSLINAKPSLWRGAGFMSPVRIPENRARNPHFPSIFISFVGHDGHHPSEYFEKSAVTLCRQNVPTTIVYHPRESHILATTDAIRDRWAKFAEFILLNK